MRVAPLLLVLLCAPSAVAQDAEAIAEPHPLREMLTARMRAQQLTAAQRVVDAQRALNHARAAAYVDTDEDGKGEFPTLPEVLGLVRWRGSQDPPAGIVGWGNTVLREDGVVEAEGYLFRVVLPGADLAPAASLADVDADFAEEDALVIAWPVRFGLSGRRTFGVHVDRRDILATESSAYSGLGAPPSPDAFLLPLDKVQDIGGLAEPLTEWGKGRDGNVWEPARGIVDLLREDELDLGSGLPEFAWMAELVGLRTPAWDAIHEAGGLRDEHAFLEGRVPPAIRLSTPREIGDAIATELRYPMERTGQWERQADSFRLVGAMTPAKYVATSNVVLFCPETLELVCAVAGIEPSRIEDVAKVLLAHECVHAFDFQTYPLQETLRDCRSEAAIAAWSAVVEGHAQQVTRRVTAGKKLEPAFADLLALSVPSSTEDTSAPPETRAAMASLAFPYHDGERFMDAVLAARGVEGVIAVLRSPPTRPMLIETPSLFLQRAPDAPPTPWTDITDALVQLEPPGADVRRSPLLRRTLKEMFAAAPQLDADRVVAGIDDAESRVAVAPGGRTQTSSTVLLCRDAEAARAYVVASRALQAAQDAAYAANPLVEPDVRYAPPAGIEGAEAGYRGRKILRSGGGDVHGFVVSVAKGRWVVEAATTSLGEPAADTERRLVRAVEETLGEVP